MMGLRTTDKNGRELPAKKPTRFMTNSKEIAKELRIRCDGSHTHGILEGRRATRASAEYPDKMCRKICKALSKEMKKREQEEKALLSMYADRHHMHVYIDDGYNRVLKPAEVKKGQARGTTILQENESLRQVWVR